MNVTLLVTGVAATSVFGVAACAIFDSESCDNRSRTVWVHLPPQRWATPSELTPDSGLHVVDGGIDAGPNTAVLVEVGTYEDWAGLPCAEVCARARDVGVAQIRFEVTTCSIGRDPKGEPIAICEGTIRECVETRY